jgi:predicted transcriptional regulator
MKNLSESELAIMIKVWDAGRPLSFEEIFDSVKEREWSEATVRTFILRIMKKGYLESEKSGRISLYSPKVSRKYLDRQSQSLLSKLYDDSVQNFIAGLYQNDALSKQDLRELKNYLEVILEES